MYNKPLNAGPVSTVDYYVEQLRDDENNDDPDPNYRCVHCDTKTYIAGEHKKRTGNWCQGDCDEYRTHERL